MHTQRTQSDRIAAKPKRAGSAVRHAGVKAMILSAGLSALAACATTSAPPPPPPPPPPPEPVIEATPYRPIPPGGAAYYMQIPPLGPDGRRQTIHRGLSQDELAWHFRSAWNVAAVNCLEDSYAPIVEGYRSYIGDNAVVLKSLNDRIENEYRRREGSARAALLAREDHMTRVYNYFAIPSARGDFCQVMLQIALETQASPPADPIGFALANFPRIEAPFENFFTAYERYQRDSAAWDAKYGDLYGPSQPGWVAVQEARARGVEIPSAEISDPAQTLSKSGFVSDPESGASIPVIPVDQGFVSQPITEPLPSDNPEDNSGGAGSSQ